MATGVTPEQIAYRRDFYAKQRVDQERHAHDTLWTPVHPRGILTIPRSLPLGVRQLVSLLLLLIYPLWLIFFFTVLIIGRFFYLCLRILLLPLAIRQKRQDPAAYAAAKNVKLDFMLQRLPSSRSLEGQDGPA